MKRWLKLAACVVTAALALPVTAYADEADPKAAFDAGIAKYREMKDLDASTNISMSLAEFSNLNMGVAINVKQKDAGASQMQYMMDMSMDVMGMKQDMSVMYHDGYVYVSSEGEKMKAALSPDEFLKVIGGEPWDMTITSADLQTAQMRQDGDNRIISFTIDPGKLTAYANALQDAEDPSGVQAIVREAGGECTLNSDGVCTGLNVNMICDMTERGTAMTMNINADLVVNNPGQPVDITFPDTSDYTQVSAGQIEEDPAAAA